jgi:sortase A
MKKYLVFVFGIFCFIIIAILIHNANVKTDYSNLNTPLVHNFPESFELVIDKINLKAPIILSNIAEEELFQKDLQNGIVHYPETALPGEVGNCYLFGHSSDSVFAKGSYKKVFEKLDKLEKGDIIIISSKNQKYNYQIYSVFVSNDDNLSVLSQNTSGKSLLTLQTSYPVGSAKKRYIIKAELQRN